MEGGEHLKPRAGPSLEVFRVMFLLSLTITFLTPTLPLVFLPDFFTQRYLSGDIVVKVFFFLPRLFLIHPNGCSYFSTQRVKVNFI